MEDLRNDLWVERRGRKPRLDPSVVHHVRVSCHRFFGCRARAGVHLLRRENVLLVLRVGEGHGRPRSLGGVEFEAISLVRGRI